MFEPESPISATFGLVKGSIVPQEADMIAHPLPRWFKFLTIFGSLGAFIFFYGDAGKPDRIPSARALTVIAHTVPVPLGNVDIPTSLSLRLTDAWDLNSPNDEFGGLSAMYASGGALTFLSDQGALVRLGRDPASPIWRGAIRPLPKGCGRMESKHLRDTESLAVDPKTGNMWIGFEGRNIICRIASKSNGGVRVGGPAAMNDWRPNGGPEAITRLHNGATLVFREVPADGDAFSDALYFDGDPAMPTAHVTRMRYRPPTGYRAVDAAQLPDGRILILNRKFAFPFKFTSRLSIVTLPNIKEGAILAGPIIARIDGEGIAENFEGLAIDNDGEDLAIWLASDDNFLSIQRTLLLRFIWPGAARLVAEPSPR
jgi:hypothetical protein